MRGVRTLIVTLLTAAIAGCGGGGSSAPSSGASPAAAGVSTTIMSSINSVQAANSYALDIWLPPGYAQGAARYPVVYATDCEYRFGPLTTMLQLRADRGATPVILVNICAGISERRFLDFTMPGAAPYFAFLTTELIPYIDATYRTNPANRILSGHSLSGEFVMYALYLEDPAHRFFSSYVSEDGSFWYDPRTYEGDEYGPAIDMELAMYNASRNLPVNLVMAGGIYSNGPHVAFLYNTIAAQGFQNLRLIQTSYALAHVPMDAPAFNDAMTFIFGD
jgi:enterochelin esterase-like enzyme